MLRWIVRVGRLSEVDWVPYIQSATRRSIQLAFEGGVEDWVEMQRARKFDLAEITANLTDGWTPWFREHPHRSVGRPRKRWEDDLVSLAIESWMTEGVCTHLWNAMKAGFVEKVT